VQSRDGIAYFPNSLSFLLVPDLFFEHLCN